MTTSKPNQKLLVTINNVQYDLTAFKEVHPGGRGILEQYHEKDATEIFEAFHGEEGRARLACLKGVPVANPQPPSPRILAFRKLRQRLLNEGYFKPNPILQFAKSASTVGLLAAGIYITWLGYWFIGAIVCGLAYQQLGWLGHDACHHGLTPWRKVNNFLGYFYGNVLNGFSVNWWKDRHNTHHAITNVLDSDPDIDNLPLFVWSQFDLGRVGGQPAETIIPFQKFYFVPFTASLKLIWNLQSFFFARNRDIQNKSFQKVLTAERITLALHYIGLFVVLRMTPSLLAAISFWLISEAIGGAAIALIVFMNHYACEQMKKEDGKEADFLTLQLTTTKNINPGFFMDWFAGGLNYQIEHHLFPTVPRHNLHLIKPIVEEFCKENDLPYVSQSYYDCLVAIESRLAEVAAAYVKSRNSSFSREE